jgi:hypothetical protein
VIIDKGTSLIPIEIKSSSTFSHSFFSWIEFWHKLTKGQQKKKSESGFVIYSWEAIDHTEIKVLNWQNFKAVLQ